MLNPNAKALSKNAQRKVQPRAKRISANTRCRPLVWIGSSRSASGISIPTCCPTVVSIDPTSLR